jgi:hypothetical protein
MWICVLCAAANPRAVGDRGAARFARDFAGAATRLLVGASRKSWEGWKTCAIVQYTMSEQLRELIEEARKVEVSDEDLEQQRRSFAFGNANIENEHVTLETVERALEQLRGSE